MPTTIWQPINNNEVVFRLPNEHKFTQIYFFASEGDTSVDGYHLGVKDLEILGSNDNQNYEHLATHSADVIYQYSFISGSYDYEYIKIISTNAYDALAEIGFYNQETKQFLNVEVEDENNKALIDEQQYLTAYPTYYEQSYFDEIYHVRNADEVAHGKYMYATVHPLLGTNIIALFISLFGLSPFVYRLPGVLFGIGMIPFLYGIAKILLKDSKFSFITTALFTFDFMHITTSRIGTLEPFSIFFIIAMFYYMLKFYDLDYFNTPIKKKLFYLFMCGLMMSCAICVKWNACYSAIGLAFILFMNLIKNYFKSKNDTEDRKEIYKKHTTSIILCCFVFFIFMPIAIYIFSFLPDRIWADGFSINNVIAHTKSMFSYHSQLNATHPYSSTWYQWLLDIRPLWYALGTDAEGYAHTIACFSHPLFTWVGLPCLFYTIYRIFRGDEVAALIFIGYFTALMPWIIFVNRIVFAYHFYPIAVFNALLIGYTFYSLYQKEILPMKVIHIFMIVYLIIFIIYLPITCGFGTSDAYRHILQLLESWTF